jgi:(2Fe-2S) ferredoxin
MGRKRHLRNQMCKRGLENETALVICVGKKCCSREESAALVENARSIAHEMHAKAKIVTVSCLDVCKKGPIAATYPSIKIKKHVTPKRARKLLMKLEG